MYTVVFMIKNISKIMLKALLCIKPRQVVVVTAVLVNWLEMEMSAETCVPLLFK
jgi:hypothetical protein